MTALRKVFLASLLSQLLSPLYRNMESDPPQQLNDGSPPASRDSASRPSTRRSGSRTSQRSRRSRSPTTDVQPPSTTPPAALWAFLSAAMLASQRLVDSEQDAPRDESNSSSVESGALHPKAINASGPAPSSSSTTTAGTTTSSSMMPPPRVPSRVVKYKMQIQYSIINNTV